MTCPRPINLLCKSLIDVLNGIMKLARFRHQAVTPANAGIQKTFGRVPHLVGWVAHLVG